MRALDRPTRNLFFTGKGGVGKTSTSCAVAVALADRGKSVLLVSTDPASNLDEVLGTKLRDRPLAVPGVPHLDAMNVDPHAAAAAYRDRVVGPYRNLLPADAIASIEEQLAGACTVEIAAFDEFAKLIGDEGVAAHYDHIVFDTAPTGHTLRLLALPAAWTGFFGSNVAGTSCVGPLQGMSAQRQIYARAVAALSDPSVTTIVLVSRPERSALDEAERTRGELAELGVRNQALVLNGVFEAAGDDPVAKTIERLQRAALAAMPPGIARLDRFSIALRSRQVVGVEALRQLFSRAQPAAGTVAGRPARLPHLDRLVEQLAAQGRGLIMTMGKGGVGKTSIAARIAIELAQRGFPVHLTTTDPAAHVMSAVGRIPPHLSVGEIDPRVEVERYRSEVMATTGANLDASGRALLQEDLSSPCTEEIAVFQAFARTVEYAVDRYVVVDTAPTGHTILLLDAAQAYHKEVMRQAKRVTEGVRKLLPRLRDPAFTRILLCTVAEATPVHEAAALQADLRRAGIEPYAWVINQSLAPLTLSDPVLAARRAQEMRYIDEVAGVHSRATFLLGWDEAIAASGEAIAEEAAHTG